jgi:hypothetical protein
MPRPELDSTAFVPKAAKPSADDLPNIDASIGLDWLQIPDPTEASAVERPAPPHSRAVRPQRRHSPKIQADLVGKQEMRRAARSPAR